MSNTRTHISNLSTSELTKLVEDFEEFDQTGLAAGPTLRAHVDFIRMEYFSPNTSFGFLAKHLGTEAYRELWLRAKQNQKPNEVIHGHLSSTG
jgi:hypothetical protein